MEAAREPFEEVFEEHLPEVKRLVARRIANPDDAADLVQEVFIRAYDAYDRFEPGTNTGAWLYRIAINVCANAAKARQRHQKYIADGPEICDLPGHHGDTSDMLARMQDHWQMRQAMESLSSDQLIVLTLRFSDGLTLPEIARVLGVSVNTVKSRLKTALVKIQSAYSYANLGLPNAEHLLWTGVGQELDHLLVDGEAGGKIYHSLGMLYLRKGLIAAALHEWSRAQKASPDFLDAYVDSAQQYVAIDQPEKAVDTLETAVSRIQSADLHLRLAELYLDKLGDESDGMRHSDLAIEMAPDNPYAHYAAGRIRYRRASIEQTASWTDPDRESILDLLVANWKKSSLHLEEAVRLKGVFPRASALLGISYFWQDRVDDALSESLTAASHAEEDDTALHFAGRVRFLAHDYETAEDYLRRALACRLTSSPLILLSQLHLRTNRYKESHDGYLQALSMVNEPDRKALIYANLAALAIKLGEYDLAIEHGEAGLRCYPNHVHCRCNLAEAYQKGGYSPHLSIKLCKEGLSIEPTHKCFHRTLAQAYYQLGKYDEGLSQATVAVEVEPEQTRNWVLRAKILAKLEQYDEARQDVKAALDLEPENEDAKKKMTEIEQAAAEQSPSDS